MSDRTCDTCAFRHNIQSADKTIQNSPCEYCFSTPQGNAQWVREKQTNADKYFHDATDEEIADFLAQRLRCEEYDCPAYDFCTDYSAEGAMTKTQFCIQVLSDWLKQEVSE